MSPESPIRVLVIEDDPESVEIIKLCLEEPDDMKMSFELESSQTLTSGLFRLETERFDALILDLILPDSTGIETVRQVISTSPAIPLLVMTNLGGEALAFEAMRLGAQDYIVKSTSDSRLLKRAIWYAMERQSLRVQMEDLITRAADAMLVVDQANTVRYLNPAAEALLGRPASQALGEPFPFTALAKQTSLVRLRGPRNGTRTAELHATPIKWRGQPAILASLRDLSSSKCSPRNPRRKHRIITWEFPHDKK